MALISELTTKLTVDDKGFSSVTKAAIGTLAAFSAAAIAASIHLSHVAETMDRLVKIAGGLDIPLEKLQNLVYVGKLAGVGVEELHVSLRKMTKVIGDSQITQTAQFADTLGALGLRMRDIAGLSPEVQFKKITDALEKMTDVNIRAAAAGVFFGKNYTGVLNMVQSGIATTSAEFNKMDLAVTKSQGHAVEMFNDSKERLGAVFQGFSEQVIAQLAPGLTAIVDGLTDSIIRTDDLKGAAQSMASNIVGSFKFMVDGLGIFLTALDRMIDKFHSFQNEMIAVRNRFSMVGKAIASGTVDPSVIGTVGDGQSTSKASDLAGPIVQFADLIRQGQDAIWAPAKLSTLTASSAIDKMASAAFGATDKFIAIESILTASTKAETDRLLKSAASGITDLPQARSSQFEKILADIIKNPANADREVGKLGSQSGTYSSETELQTLANIIDKFNQDSSVNTSGMKGALDEVKAFVSKTLDTAPKPAQVNLDISINASKEFEASYKVTGSGGIKDMEQFIAGLARQQGRRGL